MRASAPQAVTFVELFFDLVFVFAVTQVTVLTAYDLTGAGVLRAVLIFWMIWWAWTQFTWTLNPADTTHTFVRAITLLATAVAFVMATAVPDAFGDGALWFAVPYVVVRALGLWLQVRVDLERMGVDRSGVQRWVVLSVPGLIAVLAGALAAPDLRPWIWMLAVLLDLVAASMAGRRASWDLNPAHVSERHGLFVIITVGESLIVAGAAASTDVRTPALVLAAGASIAVACLLWWTYFGWLKDASEHALARVPASDLGRATRDAYSLAHFPLLCGIVGFAVAIKELTGHPDDRLGVEYAAALALGVALFIGFSAVFWRRLGGGWLGPRLVLVAVMVPVVFAAAALGPAVPVLGVAATLTAIVVIETVRAPVPTTKSGQ